MRLGRRLGLAAAWTAGMVSLFTTWDVLAMHRPFRPATLVLRAVVFLIAALPLSLLLGRVQGRQKRP